MRKDMFRTVALDRLASPEQLDQLMQVTTPKGWIALGTIGALLATALTWSIVGAVPERIDGQGILVRSGGVFEVTSPTNGRVTDLAVRVGDMIEEGQVVARLSQPDLADQITQARARVTELESRQRQLATFAARDTALALSFAAQHRANLGESIRAAEAHLASLLERIANEERLVAQGLITRQALLGTVQRSEEARERIRTARGELTQLTMKSLQERNQTRSQLETGEAGIQEARRALARLENEMRMSSEVVSPFTGRILELMTDPGGMASRGEPIMTIDLTGRAVKNLEAVVFIPSVHGKKIRPGMEIQIAPSTVKKEEYGYLLGKVTYISDYPASPGGMQRVLKNAQLVTTLSGRDAPYEVHADLTPDPRNASSYRWSSSGGPAVRIQSGTLVSAGIVVERRRPILMLLPQLRKLAGMEEPVRTRPGSATALR